jgi:hypothetical protein
MDKTIIVSNDIYCDINFQEWKQENIITVISTEH